MTKCAECDVNGKEGQVVFYCSHINKYLCAEDWSRINSHKGRLSIEYMLDNKLEDAQRRAS